jgi:hypothetical protein
VRPDWCPQDVWEKAERHAGDIDVWTGICGSGVDSQSEMVSLARAILAERERCAAVVDKAGDRVGNIETPLMRGDNLAVTLCTHFDDGGPSDDDTGWSDAAVAGYEQVAAAIRSHYSAAIRGTT